MFLFLKVFRMHDYKICCCNPYASRVLISVHCFSIASNLPIVQWVLGLKWQEHEIDVSSPSSTKVKYARNYTFTPQHVFIACCLVKHRDIFIFILKLRVNKWAREQKYCGPPEKKFPLNSYLCHTYQISVTFWDCSSASALFQGMQH